MRTHTMLRMDLYRSLQIVPDPWNRPFIDFLVPWQVFIVYCSVSTSGFGLPLCLGVPGYQMSWKGFGWMKTSLSK